MKAVLMAIKPEYVNRIISGEKKYEYRKVLSKQKAELMLIYCTSPIGKVVASVELNERFSDTPQGLWNKTSDFSGISFEEYKRYFSKRKIAYAYSLGKVRVFEKQFDISSFGLTVPPQSFVYVDWSD